MASVSPASWAWRKREHSLVPGRAPRYHPRPEGGNHAEGLLPLLFRRVFHVAGALAHRRADAPRRVAGKSPPPEASLRGGHAFLAARIDEPAGPGRPGELGTLAGLVRHRRDRRGDGADRTAR